MHHHMMTYDRYASLLEHGGSEVAEVYRHFRYVFRVYASTVFTS